MKLILLVIFLTFWRQTVAPVAKPCEILDSVRLYDTPLYPQLCNEVSEMLEWAYFCDKFGMAESQVFCRVLGYPNFVSDGRISSNTFSSLTKINNLNCVGGETLLTNCSFSETTQECRVAEGLECDKCDNNSECFGGMCQINGTCTCVETCLNGGYCFIGRCICPNGLGGVNCGQCSPPCQNGGTCSNNGTCECIAMYGGTRCELSNTTGTFETTNSITFSGQSTNNITSPTSIIPPNELVSTLIIVTIAAVISTTICSCTAIIICLATLILCGFMISRMKSFGIYKKESSNPPPNRTSLLRPHEYELDDLNTPNHDYYYIGNTQLMNQPTNNSPAQLVTNRSENGNYEIMESQAMSSHEENNPEVTNNSSSSLVDIEQESRYVVDDMKDT